MGPSLSYATRWIAWGLRWVNYKVRRNADCPSPLPPATLLLFVPALSPLGPGILVALVRSSSQAPTLYLHRLDRLARGFAAPNIPRASDTLGPAMIHLWRGYRTARYSLPSFLILSPLRSSPFRLASSFWILPSSSSQFFSLFFFLLLYPPFFDSPLFLFSSFVPALASVRFAPLFCCSKSPDHWSLSLSVHFFTFRFCPIFFFFFLLTEDSFIFFPVENSIIVIGKTRSVMKIPLWYVESSVLLFSVDRTKRIKRTKHTAVATLKTRRNP